MTTFDRLLKIAGAAILLWGWIGSPSRASDPPDSLINPQSRFIEVVDAPVGNTSTDIRHTIDRGKLGEKSVFWVSSDSQNDLSPRIAITPTGDTWVVWWRDAATDSVEVRKRDHASGSWGGTRRVSSVDEDSANPEIVHDGVSAWVAFEVKSADETSIGVSVITDEPDPILTRTLLASTEFAGSVDVTIHHEASKLWVTWVDSGAELGWCAYSYASGAWSVPANQSYAGSEVATARRVIRTTVLAEP